jgi:ketosteroid isomerase-like protein
MLWLAGGAACSSAAELTPSEKNQVEAVLADFQQAWLDGNAERVMRHISADFTLFVPGGSGTLVGKDRIRTYWFPPGDTVYRITKYETEGAQTHGSGLYAISQGTSRLGWDMVVGDSVHSSSTSVSEFVSVLKREAGAWKFYRQIFVVR